MGAVALLLSFTSSAAARPSLLPLKKARQAPHIAGFSVRGTQIFAPDGSVFVPRGVNKGGLEYQPWGYDEAFWNYQQMKSWGANFVRIPLSPAFALTRMCTYDKNYMARVDRIVRWAEQLRMLVLLDDHASSRGFTCGVGNWAAVHNKAPDLHNRDFVEMLAARYKNHPWVAIDLYNEPHDITDWVWRNGGMVDGYRAIGMQQLLEAVRSTGNKNLVFVSGNMWANDLRMVVDTPLSNDWNVVYAAHSYPFNCDRVVSIREPYTCRGLQIPPHLDTQIAPAIAKRAVMLTEFGTQRAIPGEVQAPIDWAEQHHIGWAAWLWDDGKISDFCLLHESRRYEPSVIGRPVFDALQRAAL
ncbi:MAG: endoglucanase [Actinomycetota bacterium]